jgi:hypothetical protein
MPQLILGPRSSKELDESWIVDRSDRVGPPLVGLGDVESVVRCERVVYGIGSARMLERWLQTRRLDLGERRMTTVAI